MSNIGNTGSTRSWSSIVKGPTTPPTTTPSTTTPPTTPPTTTTSTSTSTSTTSTRTTSTPTSVGSGTDQQSVQQSVSSQSSGQIQSTSQQVPKIKALSEDESGETESVSTPPLDFGSLLNRGRISESDLLSMVPDGVRDTFRPSSRISEGSKFTWSQDGHDYEVKYHSPDRGAPPGNSRNGWTAQITVDGQLMTQRGMFRYSPCNFTHIPLDN